jgi:predicted RNase H-related nuclease YkuK (DUF458 family)
VNINNAGFDNRHWKNSTGHQFEFFEVVELIKKFPNGQIHIGTDSHFKSGKLIFATVIAVYSPGICARYFFKRTQEGNLGIALPSRLLKEVQDSIEIAVKVQESLSTERAIAVHADISGNKKNKSNIVYEQARQWIMAMGFDCKMKPISWASSSIADLHAK